MFRPRKGTFARFTPPRRQKGYDDGAEDTINAFTLVGLGAFGTLTAPVYGEELTVGGCERPVTTEPTITPAIEDRDIGWGYVATGKRSGTATEDYLLCG